MAVELDQSQKPSRPIAEPLAAEPPVTTNRPRSIPSLSTDVHRCALSRASFETGMDQGLFVVTGGSAAKGSALGLEVVGSGLVQLPFSLPPFFPAMCVVHNNVFQLPCSLPS